MIEHDPYLPFRIAGVTLLIASCVHVFIVSRRDRRIGHPFMHALMCAIVLWPLSYVFWLFLWPGSLRQSFFGSDRDKAHRWARSLIEEGERSGAPNKNDHIKRFLILFAITVPLTGICVFIAGVGVAPTFGVLAWDIIILFVLPSVLFTAWVRTSPSWALLLAVILALVLCAVWCVVYYPISRFFLMGEVVGMVGEEGPVSNLAPLYPEEISRRLRGCCLLAAGSLTGAMLVAAKYRTMIRTNASTATNGTAAGGTI